MLKRLPWAPSPAAVSSADVKRHIQSRRQGSGAKAIGLALALAAIAVVAGFSVVVFGVFSPALVLLLVLLAALLYDFRIGVVALIIIYPLSISRLMPSYSGVNPQNLLLAGTLVSYWLQRIGHRPDFRLLDKRMLLCYVVPFVLAGLAGARYAGEIVQMGAVHGAEAVSSRNGFIVYLVIKPLLLVAMALMVAAAVRKSRQPERFLTPFTIAAVIPGLMICAYMAASGISLSALVTFRSFLSGLGLHANQFAVVLNMGIATTLFTALAAPRSTRRWVLLAAAMFLSMVLLLTFSRGGYLGFAVVLGAYFIYYRAGMKLLLGLVVLAAGLFFVPDAVVDRITLGLTHGRADNFSSGRLTDIWPALLEEALNSPVWGHGLAYVGRSDAVISGRMMAVGQAHNAYLDLLLEMGLIGLVLVCVFFATTYRDFKHLSKTEGNPLLAGFFRGASVGLLAMLVQAFTDDRLTPNAPQMLFWMAYGFMLGRHPRMLRADEAHASRPVGLAPGAAAGAAGVGRAAR